MSELPLGAAYHGATAEALELARKEAGDSYLPSVFNPGTLSKKGPLRVAKDRISAKYSADGKPGFDIYYELHGTGPKRISLLLGLNNESCTCTGGGGSGGWAHELKHREKATRTT